MPLFRKSRWGDGTAAHDTHDSTYIVIYFFYLHYCKIFRADLNPEESQAVVKSAQRGCADSIAGGRFKTQLESPAQPSLISELTLL